MMRAAFRFFVLSLVFVAFGCATTPELVGRQASSGVNSRIVEIDKALKGEKDEGKISSLVFERGHAYLELAEELRPSVRATGNQQDAVEFSTYLLYALQDFEAIVREFPTGTEAPEALYHVGVIYDYPYISKFGLALRYYKRTVEEYPDSESSSKAIMAIRTIEDNMKQFMDGGGHGEGI